MLDDLKTAGLEINVSKTTTNSPKEDQLIENVDQYIYPEKIEWWGKTEE